jgi:hypothetical protein
MKTIITAAIIAVTATTAMAHSPKYSETDSYKVGYCAKSISGEFDEMYEILDWEVYDNSKDYIEDGLDRDAYYAGWGEARGRVVFDPIQEEEGKECFKLIVKLAKEKFDLHK